MLFNSYIFIFLFLPLVLIGYFGLQHFQLNKAAQGYLIVMSLWFYGYQSSEYLVLLILSVLVNFILVQGMWKASLTKYRKSLFGIGLAWNIGMLFLFKYYDFFIENINTALGCDIAFLQLAMPLGISFYTFQQLAYLIDSYRKECENYSFLEYTVYALFFPKMVQGPITYHSEVIPRLREESRRHPNYENLSRGLYAFALGLAKKVLIADTLAKIVAQGYLDPDRLNTTSALLVMLCYSLQIYFDFSGYCDMAMGVGYMFNLELPINFDSPYKADSIDSFWDRWHMTLTRFFTKYVYFPLGGSRKGAGRTYLNITLVFLISGLWHGANWTFVIWGALHGIAKMLNRLFKKQFQRIPKVVRIAVTFLFTTFAWSIFRAVSVAQVKELWRQVFYGGFGSVQPFLTDTFNNLLEMKILARAGLSSILVTYPSCALMIFVLCVLISCFLMRNTQEKVQTMKLTNGKMIIILMLMMWSIVSLSDVTEFIYVNF